MDTPKPPAHMLGFLLIEKYLNWVVFYHLTDMYVRETAPHVVGAHYIRLCLDLYRSKARKAEETGLADLWKQCVQEKLLGADIARILRHGISKDMPCVKIQCGYILSELETIYPYIRDIA